MQARTHARTATNRSPETLQDKKKKKKEKTEALQNTLLKDHAIPGLIRVLYRQGSTLMVRTYVLYCTFPSPTPPHPKPSTPQYPQEREFQYHKRQSETPDATDTTPSEQESLKYPRSIDVARRKASQEKRKTLVTAGPRYPKLLPHTGASAA